MSEGEAAVETGTVEGTEGEQSAPEWQPAIEQLGEQFSSRFDEVANLIQESRQPPAEQEPEDPYAGIDAADLYDEEGEMDPQAAQQMLDRMMDQRTQQAVTPLMERIQQMEATFNAQSLKAEFPELADPEKGQAVANAVAENAEQMGRPDLTDDPTFWKLTYLASKAQDRAAGEVPAGTSPDGLEAAGGAGVPAPEVDLGQGIVDVGRRSSFWGA